MHIFLHNVLSICVCACVHVCVCVCVCVETVLALLGLLLLVTTQAFRLQQLMHAPFLDVAHDSTPCSYCSTSQAPSVLFQVCLVLTLCYIVIYYYWRQRK
jgi:hypothetical protein